MFELTDSKLIMRVDGIEVGHIIYAKQADHYVGTFVYVDPAHRGKGYADQLVAEFVKLAQGEGMKIVPVCHVIKGKLEKNYPEMIK